MCHDHLSLCALSLPTPVNLRFSTCGHSARVLSDIIRICATAAVVPEAFACKHEPDGPSPTWVGIGTQKFTEMVKFSYG